MLQWTCNAPSLLEEVATQVPQRIRPGILRRRRRNRIHFFAPLQELLFSKVVHHINTGRSEFNAVDREPRGVRYKVDPLSERDTRTVSIKQSGRCSATHRVTQGSIRAEFALGVHGVEAGEVSHAGDQNRDTPRRGVEEGPQRVGESGMEDAQRGVVNVPGLEHRVRRVDEWTDLRRVTALSRDDSDSQRSGSHLKDHGRLGGLERL